MEMISFVFDFHGLDERDKNVKGLFDVPKNLLNKEKYVDLPSEQLRKEISNTIESVLGMFDVDDGVMKSYYVDEIEFGLNIGVDGKVSIVAIENSASLDTSIKIKLKRGFLNEWAKCYWALGRVSD